MRLSSLSSGTHPSRVRRGHEGKKIGVHNPMFAAFSLSDEDQRLMGKALKELTKGTGAGVMQARRRFSYY